MNTSCRSLPLRAFFAVYCLFALSASLFSAASAAAQETGQVVGQVRNVATGAYLRSALIQIEGTNLSTLSDFGGRFDISVPAGRYSLVVSYTGLDTARVAVDVGAGAIVTRNVDLTSAIYALEPFTVTGEREGNALAIQVQRQAPNLKTVVAIDAYGNPAANPGEVLQRLAGVAAEVITAGEVRSISIRGMTSEFSTMMIDGEIVANSQGSSANRVYQPEQFGTGNLSSVELVKAPTPDQDANAVAGYVNLVTKRAFEQPGRAISLTLAANWTDRGFSGGPFQNRLDHLGLVVVNYSDIFSVFNGKNNLGIVLNLSRKENTTMQEESGNVYQALNAYYADPLSANPLTRFVGYGDFRAPTRADTFGLSVDYKIGEGSFAFAKFSYNTNEQRQELFRIGIGNAAATAAAFAAGSTFEHSTLLPATTVTSNPRIVQAPRNALNYGFNTGMDLRLFNGTALLSVRANYSHADLKLFGTNDIQALGRGFGFEVDYRGKDIWYPAFQQTAGPSLYDPASYLMSTWTRTDQRAPNDLYGARVDFNKSFATAVPTSIKIGAKYNDSQRTQRTTQAQYTFVGQDKLPNTADDSLTAFATQLVSLGAGRYGPFPFAAIPGSNSPGDPTNAPAGYWAQTAAQAYASFNTSNAVNNDFQEKITAGYISGRVDLGKLRILGGLRVETTEVSATGWTRNQTAGYGGNSIGGASFDPAVVAADLARASRSFVAPRKDTGKYRNVFPGLHFIFEPQQGLLLRSSYNRSITRPAVSNLLPNLTENLMTGAITVGNPDLKPYFSDNFELSAEKYFEPVGLFSVGVFLKEIKNYIRTVTTTLGPGGIDGSGLYANYSMTQTLNAGDARIRGIEASYQQQFRKLPGFWKGFGAFANFTYLEAIGNFGTLITTRRLPGMAPRTANAGISYVNHRYQVRLLGNWRDRAYGSNQGAQSGGIDFYREARLSLDLKANYRINKTYDIYADIMNLNKAANREDFSSSGLPWIRNLPGRVFNVGMNARF